jgi:hypothetical protein
MKYFIVLFLLTISAKASGFNKEDSLRVVDLIISDYKTLGNWDITAHIRNCTADYLLIENGMVQTLADESGYFRKNAGRVIKRNDNFEFRNVKIVGKIAYAIYVLKTSIVENGVEKNYVWTESVICRKEKDIWKIALIHSTPVK